MARRLGEAFVSIEADASLFRASAIAGMKKALAGVTGSIKVKPDMDARQVDQALASLKLRIQELSWRLAHLRAGVDTKAAEADVVKLQAKLQGLAKTVTDIKFGADTTKIDAAIADQTAKLRTLQRQASDLQLDADAAKADQKITDLTAEAFHLNKRLDSLTADVDIDKALNRLYAIEAELAVLNSDAKRIEFVANTTKLQAQIEVVRAEIARLGDEKIKLAANVDVKALLGAEAALLGLEAAQEKMAGTTEKSTAAAAKFRGIWTGGWLNGAILGIGIWHVALDALLEAVIIVTASVAALAAGAVALSESARNLATHMQGVLTVSSALGVNVPPLTGKLDDLMKAMAPRAIEIFGGGLQLIQSQAGGVLKRMEPVVNLFDTWIAKIDIWAGHQRDFGTIINAGRGFLEQLGKAVAILSDAISNLLQKDPGIAHFLLDFIQGALGLLDAFSKLPAPIVEATLAIHGAYLWLKLLVAVPILKFAQSLGILSEAQLAAASSALKFQNIVKFLLFNPFGWATIAAVSLGLLAYQLTQATAQAKKFDSSLEQALSGDTASQAILQISADIGKLNAQIADVPARAAEGFISIGQTAMQAGHSFNQVSYDINKGNIPGAMKDIGKTVYYAIKSFFGFQQVGPQMIQVQNDVAEFKGEIIKLTAEQTRLFHTTGVLVRGQNDLHIGALSVSQAFALMDLAGVKATDSFAVQYQKVKNLVTGYETLSIRGGILKNSVDAISFASLQQQERVAQLNQAWDTFFKTVTGGEGGFLTFAKQTIGLFRVLAANSVKMGESNGKISTSLSGLAKASTGAKVSMTGLNDVSINARQTFLQSADAANTQIDNLTTLANAAGLGQKGTDLLTRATQDMVAALIPATGGSKALTDVLFALAQHGGYPGANSMKDLSKWVSKVKNPMTELDGITTTLTTDASNLTEDVKNLSIALGQNLNDAMAAAIIQATGGQKAFDDFANAMLHTKKNSQAQQTAALALANQLVSLTGNTKDAHNEFDSFAQQMGISRKDADALWSEISGKLSPALNDQANKVLPDTQKAFVNWAKGGLELSKGKANDLWGEITAKLGPKLDALGNLAGGPAKQKFIDWAMNGLHLSQQKANALWHEVDTLQSHINALHGKDVKIIAEASGSGQIAITGTGWALGQGNVRFHAAQGAYVRSGTTTTADDVPAMLSKGELVVPAKMVTGGMVDHLRGMIPGFNRGGLVKGYANGGFVGLEGQIDGATGAASAIGGNLAGKAVHAAVAQAIAAIKKQVEKKSQSMMPGPVSAGGHVSWTPGAGVNQWRLTTLQALAMLGLPSGLVLDVLYQMMTESGGNPTIVNKWDSNWAAGHPSVGLMQVIAGTYATYGAPRMGYPGPVAYGVSENPLANIYAALNYGKNNGRGFGTGPGQIGSGHGYAAGGLVGYATGGKAPKPMPPSQVSREGSAFLKAWQTRHGGGFGAAWGPIVVNQQIAAMQALQHRNAILSKASGLTGKQHQHYAALAADEKRRLGTLNRELVVERAWRTQLGASDATLQTYVKAAGSSKALRKNVLAWKSQISRQKGTIGSISKMLGYSNAQIAAMEKAGKLGPGGKPLPKITHTFGGDVGDTIGAFLASVIAPLGMAQGGRVKSYDKGGWLSPGLTMAYNGTGRNERVGDSNVTVTLEIDAGSSGADQFLAAMIKKYVKVNGAGNVQKAYGAH